MVRLTRLIPSLTSPHFNLISKIKMNRGRDYSFDSYLTSPY